MTASAQAENAELQSRVTELQMALENAQHTIRRIEDGVTLIDQSRDDERRLRQAAEVRPPTSLQPLARASFSTPRLPWGPARGASAVVLHVALAGSGGSPPRLD